MKREAGHVYQRPDLLGNNWGPLKGVASVRSDRGLGDTQWSPLISTTHLGLNAQSIPPVISPAVPAPSPCSEFEAGAQPKQISLLVR